MMKRKKTLLLGILIVPMVAFAFQVALMGFVKAGHSYDPAIHYIKGWIWGGSKSSSGILTGVGWGSMSGDNVSGGADYQVDVPFWDCEGGECNATGYAWHENIGWIDFNPSGPYPGSPNHSVKRENDRLTGWARITGIEEELGAGNSGGWEGWVKMSGSGYGVDLSEPDDSYAWSDELGWIQFSNLDLPDVPQMQVCPDRINIALDESVGINEDPDDGETSEQLNAIYAETFLKYDNCTTAQSFLSQGKANIENSASNWSVVDSEFSEFVNLDKGEVTSKGIADTPTDELFEVEAELNGASDTSEVCIYDCSCAKSEYFADEETCDCGCGITAETRRAYGEDWEETAN